MLLFSWLLLALTSLTWAIEAPVITTIQPSLGTPVGGTTVTISGSNLTGTTAVTFGGNAASSVTVVNGTTVTCITPAKVIGVVNVVLTANGQSTTATNSFSYVAQSSSPKKGVGAAGGTKAQSLADIKVAWCYNWTASPLFTSLTVPSGCEFVPQIWNGDNVTTFNLNLAKSAGTTLLGFNEPDHSGQANMTPAQALSLWPQLMAANMRLGSPAPAGSAAANGSWTDTFMQGVASNSYRVDFIAVHLYCSNYDAANAATTTKNYLQSVYNKWKKPIWLTEFALKNWNTGATPATGTQQTAYIKRVLPILESLPFVERYAWFQLPDYPGDSFGLADSSGALNAQGVAYRDLATYATGTPISPSSLTAAATATQITLTWTDNANNDAGTRIERKTGSGGTWAEISTLYAPDQSSYVDDQVTTGNVYYYRVKVYNKDGNSSASNEASATLSGGSPTYAVTYNGNGSTGGTPPAGGSYNAGVTVTVLGNTGTLVKNGYSFVGWNSAANGSGASYSTGATFTMPSAPVTLYAKWTATTYTVTGVILVGGSGVAGVTVSDGTRTAVTDATGTYTLLGVPAGTYTITPTMDGYTFTPTSTTITVSGNSTVGTTFSGNATSSGSSSDSHGSSGGRCGVGGFAAAITLGLASLALAMRRSRLDTSG